MKNNRYSIKKKKLSKYIIFFIKKLVQFTKEKSKELYNKKNNIIPNNKLTSPILLIINAFIAALFAAILVYQKLINKYEHKPTPSQPINNCKKFPAVTNKIIKKVNKDK